MKNAVALAVAALALAPVGAVGQEEKAKAASGPEAEIRHLEDEIRQASIKRDAATFERLWADGYIRTNSRGQVSTKAEALEDFRTGEVAYTSLEFSDVRIHLYNDGATAVVSSKAMVLRDEDDPDLSGEFRHTRVWVKGAGGWQVVAFHASRVDEEDEQP